MKALTRFYALALLTGLGLENSINAAENSESKPADSKVAPVYSVDTYDPKRNPEEDLAATVKKAKAGSKRILIQVGGDWCGWCKLMNKYFHENEKVAAALAKDFIIMKVNFSKENDNKEFLKKYPGAQGYPHLYVLESDGTFLHSQGTGALEEGKSYNEKVMLDFLANWAPKKAG
jgi:thiol:disulfide interchange protein